MERPCFLVVDNEFPGSISTRKLVIESAKFNVITAYSGHEAIVTLKRFPRVNAIVMNAHLEDIPCEETARQLKSIAPSVPIIVTSTGNFSRCGHVEHYVDNYDPKELLAVLQSLKPTESTEVKNRDKNLEASS